jgi:hypothetical protein
MNHLLERFLRFAESSLGGKRASPLTPPCSCSPSNCRFGAKLLIDLLWNNVIYKIILAIMWQIRGEFVFQLQFIYYLLERFLRFLRFAESSLLFIFWIFFTIFFRFQIHPLGISTVVYQVIIIPFFPFLIGSIN